MVVRYLSHKTAYFVEAFLAFLLVIALVFAVVGFVKARDAQVEINSVQAARIADQRARIYSDYAACRAGIPNLKRINRFLFELKEDYLDRAETSMELANLPSISDGEKAIRLDNARLYKEKAAHVPIFPVGTKKECAQIRNAALLRIGHIGPGP